MEYFFQLVFLLVVYVSCKSAMDFVIERHKRIKRKRRHYEDRIGWILLVCVILCFVSQC